MSARIAVYPAPAGARLRHDWLVRVRPAGGDENSWQSLDTYRVKVDMHDVAEASMAYCDADFAGGAIEVEVRKAGWSYLYTADVRPLSLGIEAEVNPKSLRFTLDRPVNCSVELNKDRRHNLHLFVGALSDVEHLGDDADVVIEGNPNKPNTLHLDWAAREALEDMASRPESERRSVKVLVKRAHYCVADCVMDLPGDVDVVLEGGVVLDGAFRIRHQNNVAIRGRGVFDLADYKRFSGLSGLLIEFARQVTVDGPIFINPPHYTVMLGASQDVTIRNIKSFSCEGWSDGIDMMACHDIRIADCFLRTSDDCIAIYASRWAYRGGTSNVGVHDCVLWADVAHPMMIGTHGDHEHGGGDVLENLRFNNVDVLEHNEYQPNYLGVMAINAGDGNVVRDVTWRDIRIEQFRHGRVFDIETKFNRDYNPIPGRLVEHVRIEDIAVAADSGEEPSIIAGYDAEHPVCDIRVSNVMRGGVPCTTLQELNVRIGPNAQDSGIDL